MLPEARARFEARLGWTFRDEPGLAQALSHRSWCAEHPDEPSNERLEFLGDAVLGIIVTDHVFRIYPSLQEGQLAKVRASVVNAEVLADVALGIELGPCLRLGKGEDASGGRAKTSILADAMEAIIAAVYLDGGPDVAHDVVMGLFGERIAEAASGPGGDDYKTRLQELAAQRFDKLPRYQVYDEGPDHAKRFFATVLLGGEPRGSGEGGSKKQAEQAAARAAWRWLSAQAEGTTDGDRGIGEGAPPGGTTAGSAMGGTNAGAT
ncbi:MAG TPA: ribonuclease III [Acidimicrobiia bacterium]